MSDPVTINLDFSRDDAEQVEILPAGFDALMLFANQKKAPTAIGGFGFPSEAPRVWFVTAQVAHDEDSMVHLAVCTSEAVARNVTQRIGQAFMAAGVAEAHAVIHKQGRGRHA